MFHSRFLKRRFSHETSDLSSFLQQRKGSLKAVVLLNILGHLPPSPPPPLAGKIRINYANKNHYGITDEKQHMVCSRNMVAQILLIQSIQGREENHLLLVFCSAESSELQLAEPVSFFQGLKLVMKHGPYIKLIAAFLFTSLAFMVRELPAFPFIISRLLHHTSNHVFFKPEQKLNCHPPIP